jgi:hypothetical protein
MAGTAAKFMNTMPQLILSTPAHRLLSARYLILEFTGRKTGRRYTVPVAYRRHLLISTDSPWWRNIAASHRSPSGYVAIGTPQPAPE